MKQPSTNKTRIPSAIMGNNVRMRLDLETQPLLAILCNSSGYSDFWATLTMVSFDLESSEELI